MKNIIKIITFFAACVSLSVSASAFWRQNKTTFKTVGAGMCAGVGAGVSAFISWTYAYDQCKKSFPLSQIKHFVE